MKKNDFKWDEQKPIRKDIQDNDVAIVYIPVKMHFKYSDKIVDDIDEEGNTLSFKEGFLMNIAEPLKPNQVYQGQGAQFLYSVIENPKAITGDLSPDNVCPACEYGKCEVCGKEASLGRTYWYYPVKCDCHTPTHFELVRHCNECKPVEPKQTMICTHHEDGRQWNILVPTNIFIKENSHAKELMDVCHTALIFIDAATPEKRKPRGMERWKKVLDDYRKEAKDV